MALPPPVLITSMQLRCVDSAAGLEAIAAAWRELPGARANPLLSHDWFCAAADTLHAGERLAVHTAWHAGRLAAAAPLVEVKRGPARWLEFIGSRHLYEPCDFLYQDQEALEFLVRRLVHRRRPLALHRVPKDGPVSRLMAAQRTGILFRMSGSQCLRVDVTGTWAEYLDGRSSHCRRGFPQQRRKMSADGELRFEFLQPEPSQLDALLDDFVRVESSGWKLASGSALSKRAALLAFVRNASHRFSAQRQLRVHVLRCGGQTAAAQWMLEYGGRLWELKIGYDERWREMSPGRLLLWETLQGAFARQLEAFEFLGTGDGQQCWWATSAQSLETLVWYPYSMAGVAAALTDASHRALRFIRGST
jgi:CelD/BcsL family acetyltransferase involved in cellulose biosynthesis